MFSLLALAAVVLSACGTGSASPTASMGSGRSLSAGASVMGGSSIPAGLVIKIGSDGFYESKLMAEIYAQTLEAHGYTVDRAGFGMGTRAVTAAALESGQIDLKPEYVGSVLAYYKDTVSGNPDANIANLSAVLMGKGGGITVLDYSPAADQNAFVVSAATEAKYHLSKMSDLTAVASQLKFGVATDCATNPVCAAVLKSAYNLDLSGALPLSACGQPMVDALAVSTIQVGELCSTQPDIARNGWVVLTDDKKTQPADNLAPLVRNDLLAKLGRVSFEAILNEVSAKMTTARLTSLNVEFVFDKKDISTIAHEWLSANPIS